MIDRPLPWQSRGLSQTASGDWEELGAMYATLSGFVAKLEGGISKRNPAAADNLREAVKRITAAQWSVNVSRNLIARQ